MAYVSGLRSCIYTFRSDEDRRMTQIPELPVETCCQPLATDDDETAIDE